MKRKSEISTHNQPQKKPKITSHNFLRRCARNPKQWSLLSNLAKKKSSSSGSIKEITKVSFESAVLKSPVTGEVSKPSSWVKYQCIGKGTYGSVYLARSTNAKNQTITAIKSAKISRASSLMHEKKILTRLLSPYVVGCYGHEIASEKTQSQDREITKTNYNLILEYCSGESLTKMIKTNGGRLPEKDVKLYARDILHGLFYIHGENIIHCDIKPDNILLSPYNNPITPTGYLIKIADFGLAMEKDSIKYRDGKGFKRGTARYMAPEVMSYGVLDYGVDIWAFGCTVLEMFTGQLPWTERGKLGSFDLEHLIGVSDCVPYIPDCLSEDAKDFLSRCFVKEAALRWGITALLDHPFLKDVGLKSY